MTSTRPREPMNQDPTQLTMLTINAPPSAVQNPAILKPGSMSATSPIIAAFTTSRKSPSVNSSAGSDSSRANGLTTAFTRPNNNPARISVSAVSIVNPDSSSVAAQRPSAAMRPRRMNPAMFNTSELPVFPDPDPSRGTP